MQRYTIIDFQNKHDAETSIRNLNGRGYDGRKLVADFCFKHEKLLEENRKLDKRFCLNIFGVNKKEDLNTLLADYEEFHVEFKVELVFILNFV